MTLIDWDESMSVHVAEIDQQHKRLIAIINDLFDAMTEGKGKDALEEIVNGLISYTQLHFKTEEQYFDRFGYPDSSSHKIEHADFIQKISSFKEGVDRRQLGLSSEVLNFLSGWLKNHILKTDKKYSVYFNEKGLV